MINLCASFVETLMCVSKNEFSFSGMDKRMITQVQKFRSPKSGYLLLYFEDGAYEIIHSNHSLLPSGFDYESTKIKSEIMMKPGFEALVLSKSEFESDLKLHERRLTAKLDLVKPSLDDSFGFLDKTTEVASGSEISPNLSSQVSNESESSLNRNSQMPPGDESDSDGDTVILDPEDQPKTNVSDSNSQLITMLRQQTVAIKKQLNVQKSILNELKSLKKFVKGKGERCKPKENVAPVMYNDTDLAILGHRNLDPSQYGVFLARHLFNDQELSSNMLFPKRSTSRPPLSPNRSRKFVEAVANRFDDEAIEEATKAVNSLGNDLKKGRRKRKIEEM